MKALILAAGYGTRLGELTKNKAKPLLEIKGKPLIEYTIEKIQATQAVDLIYIVTNAKFYHDFKEWLKQYNPNTQIKIINDRTTSNETRLGAVGDISYVVEQENIDDDLFVIAGDNLFEFSLTNIINLFKQRNSSIVAGRKATKEEIAGKYGNIILGEDNQIIDFEEKPKQPKSDIASTAVYLFNKQALKELKRCIEEQGQPDNPGDFVKYLSQKQPVYAYIFEQRMFDIGSKEQLEEANQLYRQK